MQFAACGAIEVLCARALLTYLRINQPGQLSIPSLGVGKLVVIHGELSKSDMPYPNDSKKDAA